MMNISDRDRRQLNRMAERLDLFAKGTISLCVLIADVDYLLVALDGMDESISQELRQYWEVLEEVYSVALVMHGGVIDTYGASLVQNSVTALRKRVGELAGTPTPESSGIGSTTTDAAARGGD